MNTFRAGLRLTGLICFSVIANATFAENLKFRTEVKAHYRSSEHNRFAIQFPFAPEALPRGESNAFLETVNAGEHAEVSSLSFLGIWQMHHQWQTHFKFELLDKYDRNPTSSDHKADIDHLFVRYGKHHNATRIPDNSSLYFQLGKFAKFERQKERRTESYGLVSTAFNRFEDSGIEFGFDLSSGIYLKGSWTTGNPVFIRDPNALAGDNGTRDRRVPPNHPNPELKSGIVILYDAEVEDFDLGDESETAFSLGYRYRSRNENLAFDTMLFASERTLAENRELHGTFYGADLDLFDLGELPDGLSISLPREGNEKKERGANLWLTIENFSLFAQVVDQEMAGLERTGQEVELAYVFDWGIPVSPVIRYSEVDNDFVGSPLYPAPSVWWDWEKIDIGLNFDLTKDFRMTIEHADNRFIRGGRKESNNESLLTFRWRHNKT